ncbi:MAG: hypothetical protein JXA81_13070 [Sedimentisphaerales bacterium]|nr:hypothetical protein [Sedimentisphaerales bacterium]
MSRILNKTIGRILVPACLMLLTQASLILAAEDITGQWEMTMEFGGRDSYAMLTISKNADGTLAGKWGSRDNLSDVKFQDGKLTFVRTIQFGDQEFSMDYAGTLKDGKITGAMSSDQGEFDVNGVRFKPKSPALGTWDIRFNIGDRDITGQLAVSEKPDGTLEGKWMSDRGNTVISNVKFKDGKLTFSRKSTFGDNTYESDFDGTIAGNDITGVFKSQQGEMPAKGTRVGAALVGKWDLTSVSEFGTMPGMMRINGDMTGRYEFFGGEIPMKDLKLYGNQVTFALEMGWGDETFTLNFKGTLDGKNLKGQMTSDRGTSEITGKKAEEASAVIGTWEFTRETQQETRTSMLKIMPDMTGTYTFRDNPVDIKDLKVNGNNVSFKIEMSFNDRQFTMEFKGKIEDKTLKGEFITQRGAREAIGKKID